MEGKEKQRSINLDDNLYNLCSFGMCMWGYVNFGIDTYQTVLEHLFWILFSMHDT